MRIAGIVRDSIVDGVGIRDVIFVQGCPHHCKGCHNPESWNTDGGVEMSIDSILNELANSSNHITISGGEPFDQLAELGVLCEFICSRQFKLIWLYTGYRFEQIPINIWWELYYRGVTVVVDGRYEEDKRDTNLLFRGSSNQRLIDLPKSLKANKVILWEDNNEQV